MKNHLYPDKRDFNSNYHYEERVKLHEKLTKEREEELKDIMPLIKVMENALSYAPKLDDMHTTMRHQSRWMDEIYQRLMSNGSISSEHGLKMYLTAFQAQEQYRKTARELRFAEQSESYQK